MSVAERAPGLQASAVARSGAGPFLVDISRLVETLHRDTPTGIERVEMAYAQHFLARDDDVRFVLTWPHFTGVISRARARPLIEDIARRWSQAHHLSSDCFVQLQSLLRGPIDTGASRVAAFGEQDRKRDGTAWRTIADLWLRSATQPLSRHLAEFERRGACYVHVSQFRLNRPQRFAWLAKAGVRSLFMLHDLIPILHPEYCRPGEAARHRARLDTMVRHASVIVANSHVTRSLLERRLAAECGNRPFCEVVPPGLPPTMVQAQPVRSVETECPYFVVVGTIEPRKNILFLLSVWHRWTQGGGNPRARLVIVGRRGWESENVASLLDRSTGLAPTVITVGSLGDAGMVALLRGAAALIAPSFVEGYGLPVAEALALGVPVLASDIPAHREVGGDCADYIHSLDGKGWSQALDDYCTAGSPRRAAQRARLTQYAPPSWADHMARIETLLSRLHKNECSR